MGQRVSRTLLALIGELCEAAAIPRTGGEKMSDYFPREGAEAIRLGAFRQGPQQTMVPDRSNHEGRYVEAEWDAATRSYRYFSVEARGWVTVPREDLLTWELDLNWLLGWIAGQFGLTLSSEPKALIPGHLWLLGTPWIGKRRCGLFFARRLGFGEGYDQVADALRDRSGEPPGVLLTTSRWSVRNVRIPGNHRVVRLQDCLEGDGETARIDLETLARTLAGLGEQDRDGPLQYSNDYSSVTVNGRTFVFRGDTQKQAVGRLIEARERGEERMRTSSLLTAIDSGAGQILRLFKGHPDWKELIGYGDGFCWLKI